MRGSLALAALVAAAPAGAASIDDPICTDRPGFNSSTCTVPKGHFQLETGLVDWSLTKDGSVRSTTLTIGASALKYGLTESLHIELALEPWTRTRSRSAGVREADSGMGDLVVKLKQELQSSNSFSAAIIPYVKVPTASKRIGNGKAEGGVVVGMEWSLADTPLSLGTSPQFDLVADADGSGYHAAMAQVIGASLAATDRWSVGAELWGAWDWDETTTRQAAASANSALRLSDNFQVDAQVAVGLTRATPDLALSGGVSMRF